MYFGPPVDGPYTVGASVLPLVLCLKEEKNN